MFINLVLAKDTLISLEEIKNYLPNPVTSPLDIYKINLEIFKDMWGVNKDFKTLVFEKKTTHHEGRLIKSWVKDGIVFKSDTFIMI